MPCLLPVKCGLIDDGCRSHAGGVKSSLDCLRVDKECKRFVVFLIYTGSKYQNECYVNGDRKRRPTSSRCLPDKPGALLHSAIIRVALHAL